MNKKLLVSLFLCFFVFFSVVLAEEEKIKTIEFLVRDTVFPHVFEYIPNDVTAIESFNSGTLLELQVPPSPKSDAIFFYFNAQYYYEKSSHLNRMASSIIWYNIISDIIPDEYEVKQGMSLLSFSETNNSGDVSSGRSWRNHRYALKRNSACAQYCGELMVVYKGTMELIPEDIAIPIINALIDNGFSVEIFIEGKIQGLEYLNLLEAHMEISRLSKNPVSNY